ncbi:VOC family protein [Paenibacillus sp.]|uniref:VOC family protein n=1 Tax=Paenibacillus sp. TaxID=58172 RepID=UPI002D74D9F8|nr:VOC family protein [Paenibacillus sp.]HZG56731.1 VOC family protein [Paenibacillus sp.]
MASPVLCASAYICQIGFIVKDAEAASRAYADFFGLPDPFVVWTDPVEQTQMTYRGTLASGRAKLAFLNLPQLQLEFIQPDDGDSGWKDFLDAEGEGFHHFAVKVKDMAGTLAALRERGYAAEQTGEFTGGRYACLDSRETLKTVLELLEEDGNPLPVVPEGGFAVGPAPRDSQSAVGTKRVVHLGFLTKDAAAVANAYAELFGARTWSFETDGYDRANTTYLGRPAEGRARIHLVDMGPLQLEFIQPDGADSVWRADLDRKGEGFHHLAFDFVEDLDGTCASLASLGIPLTQRGSFDGGAYVYVDASAKLKTNLELLARW